MAKCVLLLLYLFAAAPALATDGAEDGNMSESEPVTPIPDPPAQNPSRVALGEILFRDPRLSRDGKSSCLSCHDIQSNGASSTVRDVAPDGHVLPLNTPTVFNTSLDFRLNWEGNFPTLEAEADDALHNSMASGADEAVARLQADPAMVQRFRDAYGEGPDRARLLDAIATFERALVTPGSRFDRWLGGDKSALTATEISGYALFKSLGCVSCHQGVNMGGNLMQRHGIFRPLGTPEPIVVRVPSLRNVATTAPYFHDGSAATLPEAVKSMGLVQLDRVLTQPQIDRLVAFLGTLTGDYQGRPVTAPTPASGSTP